MKYKIPILLFSLVLLAGGAKNCTAAETAGLAERFYDRFGIETRGYLEALGGLRTDNGADEKDGSAGEVRMQLELSGEMGQTLFTVKGDLAGDAVSEEISLQLREANMLFSPADIMDVKVGRQVLTWGTGDLIFINDMFPKDWQSFFIGRDDEYLKKPSNALKTSFFFEAFNLDLVLTPLLEGSEFISGQRLSYYNPLAGRVVGRDMVMAVDEPESWFSQGEIAARLSKHVSGVELALYGYSGFWQEPEGFDPARGEAIYPRLNVWGGSVRGTIFGGIGNLEAGYYDSVHDQGGRNPLVRPSEYRFLAGFERELAHELTGGFQYYLEVIDGYDNYTESLPAGAQARDELRHLLTMRLTRLLMDQNLILSLFVYYSPSDNDGYARPKATYKLTDQWLVEGGLNLFWGEHDYTFWGQFRDNSNIYARVRYSF
ncbi:hypothetical protein GF1_25370 [Desulfolithobacter dissulfuricans]|uniref:Uncharacterized protein n=1 Tax=Desulfolithobacter dissulfuricans TaxID=2795293 RepID=A0A915UAP0_9BACT|nr:hypothetical protein [Desulfolithobacter dissulfuricans]BCO10161.1 hypothetical protein GF1_25370 [Desulfolithobacter dissulfuricans]